VRSRCAPDPSSRADVDGTSGGQVAPREGRRVLGTSSRGVRGHRSPFGGRLGPQLPCLLQALAVCKLAAFRVQAKGRHGAVGALHLQVCISPRSHPPRGAGESRHPSWRKGRGPPQTAVAPVLVPTAAVAPTRGREQPTTECYPTTECCPRCGCLRLCIAAAIRRSSRQGRTVVEPDRAGRRSGVRGGTWYIAQRIRLRRH
jgi:hypothetical protein